MYMEFWIFGHRLLGRDLFSPKLKVPPRIMYVNNTAGTIYSR